MVRTRAAAALLLSAAMCPGACSTPSILNAQAVSDSKASVNRRATEWPQALRIADFILSLQNAAGAIPDRSGVNTVNEDSNMEYALIGLGAAYAATNDRRYLDGLERWISLSSTTWIGMVSAGAHGSNMPPMGNGISMHSSTAQIRAMCTSACRQEPFCTTSVPTNGSPDSSWHRHRSGCFERRKGDTD